MVKSYYEDVISINDIVKDDHFRISRNLRSPELIASIKNSGMIEKPFFIKKENSYYPFTCHNRIDIITEIGIAELEAFILESPSSEIFIKNLLIKNYRNECGPVGKIKAIRILQNDFGLYGSELKEFARKALKISNEIFSDGIISDRIMQLPGPLRDYIDVKDIPFKLLKDIVSFDEESIVEFNRWIEKVQIRLNIFKMLVDFVFDIKRRDGHLKQIDDDILTKMDDKALYDYVFRIRYPEYILKREKADNLISLISKPGVCVDFPEFFEKDQIAFRFILNKKNKSDRLAEIVSGIDKEKINDLLSLL